MQRLHIDDWTGQCRFCGSASRLYCCYQRLHVCWLCNTAFHREDCAQLMYARLLELGERTVHN